MSDIYYPVKKADIFPLLTLTYDESIISSTLNILRKITQVLGLTEEVIRNKVIILKGDLLMIQNTICVILKKQNKSYNFDHYDWIEPIIGLFYL